MVALNNAAVVCFEQNTPWEGLAYYARALAVEPGNQVLLDNVTEALHANNVVRAGATYENVIRLMNPAETRKEGEMANLGLVRYGSRWLDRNTAGRLQGEKQGIVNTMRTLDAQYQGAMSAELADERALLVQLANSPYGATENAYNAYVQQARSLLELKLQNMKDDAAMLNMELTEAEKQQFPGVQRLMEVGEAGH